MRIKNVYRVNDKTFVTVYIPLKITPEFDIVNNMVGNPKL